MKFSIGDIIESKPDFCDNLIIGVIEEIKISNDILQEKTLYLIYWSDINIRTYYTYREVLYFFWKGPYFSDFMEKIRERLR